MTVQTIESNRSPYLSIIIVTFNSDKYIISCIDALIEILNHGAEIIIVDNFSTDSTITLIESSYPQIRLIKNSSNLGFAKAVNIGYRFSVGEVICLINPDLIIDFESCLSLSLQFKNDMKLGVLGPLIKGTKREMQILASGNFPILWRMFLHSSGIAKFGQLSPCLEGHYLYANQAKFPRDVEWLSGACMFSSRQCWDSIGGMNEKWFMYAEDIDYCFRAYKLGYKTRLDPNYVAIHYVGASATNDKAANCDWIVNLYDFYLNSYSPNTFTSLIWRILVSTGLLIRSFKYFLNSKTKSQFNRLMWKQEARLFRIYAFSLFDHKRHAMTGLRRHKNG